MFGFLSGFIATESLLIALAVEDDFRFKAFQFYFLVPAVWAVPWVIIWGGSGAVCESVHGHPGTLATLAAITFGVGYSFWEGPKQLHPWLPITITFYTFLAAIPCHLVVFVIAALLGYVRDPEEAT